MSLLKVKLVDRPAFEVGDRVRLKFQSYLENVDCSHKPFEVIEIEPYFNGYEHLDLEEVTVDYSYIYKCQLIEDSTKILYFTEDKIEKDFKSTKTAEFNYTFEVGDLVRLVNALPFHKDDVYKILGLAGEICFRNDDPEKPMFAANYFAENLNTSKKLYLYEEFLVEYTESEEELEDLC